MTNIVVSLFDYTGEAVKPWAEAGYDCYCFDLQHEDYRSVGYGSGSITFVPWDASDHLALNRVADRVVGFRVAMLMAFPPCTDLAASGARHWKAKAERNPAFQLEAAAMAKLAAAIAGHIGRRQGQPVPYMIENPNGALSRLWRQPDHRFDPCDFGGYIPEDDAEHPLWPEYIPARDAYTKRTCLWTDGGFVMPEKDRVEPELHKAANGDNYARPIMKLGGKSMRTKNIRSATPRGFARAVFLANHKGA